MIDKEQFREQVNNRLQEYGFEKSPDKDLWTKNIISPGGVQTVVVDGKAVKVKNPDHNFLFKVEFVGDGSIDEVPLIQVLFEISENFNILMSYEEAMEYDMDLFNQILLYCFSTSI